MAEGGHEVLFLAAALEGEGEGAEVVLADVLPLEVDLRGGASRIPYRQGERGRREAGEQGRR